MFNAGTVGGLTESLYLQNLGPESGANCGFCYVYIFTGVGTRRSAPRGWASLAADPTRPLCHVSLSCGKWYLQSSLRSLAPSWCWCQRRQPTRNVHQNHRLMPHRADSSQPWCSAWSPQIIIFQHKNLHFVFEESSFSNIKLTRLRPCPSR